MLLSGGVVVEPDYTMTGGAYETAIRCRTAAPHAAGVCCAEEVVPMDGRENRWRSSLRMCYPCPQVLDTVLLPHGRTSGYGHTVSDELSIRCPTHPFHIRHRNSR